MQVGKYCVSHRLYIKEGRMSLPNLKGEAEVFFKS